MDLKREVDEDFFALNPHSDEDQLQGYHVMWLKEINSYYECQQRHQLQIATGSPGSDQEFFAIGGNVSGNRLGRELGMGFVFDIKTLDEDYRSALWERSVVNQTLVQLTQQPLIVDPHRNMEDGTFPQYFMNDEPMTVMDADIWYPEEGYTESAKDPKDPHRMSVDSTHLDPAQADPRWVDGELTLSVGEEKLKTSAPVDSQGVENTKRTELMNQIKEVEHCEPTKLATPSIAAGKVSYSFYEHGPTVLPWSLSVTEVPFTLTHITIYLTHITIKFTRIRTQVPHIHN